MVNMELLAWCLGIGSIYLLVVSMLLEFLGRRLDLTRGIAGELIEPFSWIWFIMLFVMETLFYVAIPTLAAGAARGGKRVSPGSGPGWLRHFMSSRSAPRRC